MRFEYPLLEALAAVVREGTFEAAARSLNITQSAVSQRVKLLEEKIGAILIKRGRPCVPTEHGLKLYRHIDQVLLLEHDLEKSLMNIDASRKGVPAEIRIAVNGDSIATWFPEVIRRASSQLNVYFDIIPDDQEHTAERLKNGEVIAAVTTEETPIQGCKRISLGAMEYMAVATPRMIETYFADGVNLDTLIDAPVIEFDRKDMIQRDWLLNCFGTTAQLQSNYVPSYPGYLSCCVKGIGWGLLPRPAVDDHLKDGTLRELIPGKSVMVVLFWQTSVRSSEVMRDLSRIVFDVSKNYLTPPPNNSFA